MRIMHFVELLKVLGQGWESHVLPCSDNSCRESIRREYGYLTEFDTLERRRSGFEAAGFPVKVRL